MTKIDLVVNTTKKSGGINSKTFIMLHHTAQIASLESMTFYLSKNPAEVSVHYVISEDGRIAKIGTDEDILWHAGNGNLIAGYVNTMNANSIGIEVISDGKTFTKKSIDTLSVLVSGLQKKYYIPNDRVIRHKDYTTRKTDIGDNFFKVAGYDSYNNWLNRNIKSYEMNNYKGVPIIRKPQPAGKPNRLGMYNPYKKEIILYPSLLIKPIDRQESVYMHEFCHHVQFFRLPYNYIKTWIKIYEYDKKMIDDFNKKSSINFDGKKFLNSHAEKHWREDMAEQIELRVLVESGSAEKPKGGTAQLKYEIACLMFDEYENKKDKKRDVDYFVKRFG